MTPVIKRFFSFQAVTSVKIWIIPTEKQKKTQAALEASKMSSASFAFIFFSFFSLIDYF